MEKANALAKAGHDVCLIVNNPPGRTPAYSVDPRVQFVDISLAQPKGLFSTMRFKWEQNKRVARALKRFRPDVRCAAASWLCSAVLWGPGRLVLESHSWRKGLFSDEARSLYKRLKVALAERTAACVVTLLPEHKADWPAAKRVESIGNFSDITANDSPARRGAMAVGRLAPVKQFDLLIDAWKIVTESHPGATLDIYGDGPLREELQRLIDEAELNDRIFLRGDCEDLAAEYASHEFLVLSSRDEGFGLVLIEAMQCGCPCVAVDCPGGPAHIITDGDDGILVPYRNLNNDERIAALASAAGRMLDDSDMRRKMGAKARLNVNRFSKNDIMSRWQNLFKSII
ncbi:MAG: glycosyltransferase family 4 protein [Muribaculaceae bacterium]|nr:glycosyltransferase family 4 protein [Muribaculaceae bacterium]